MVIDCVSKPGRFSQKLAVTLGWSMATGGDTGYEE